MAKKYNEDIEQKIVELYKEGISPYKMTEIIPELKDKRPSVIYGILKRLNVKTKKTITITDEQKAKRRKYHVNDDYFEVIDTEEKAYWLGFLYADGYLTTGVDKVGIALNSVDREHLCKFKNDICATNPIHDYEEKSGYGAGTIYSRILITSKKIKSDLIKLGIYENKSLTLKFPNETQIPNNLIRHFIRGYFDGDGSLTYGHKQKCGNSNYSIKFTGTLEMISGIQKYLNTSVKLEQKNKNINNYSVTIGGNRQVERVLDDLYKNSTVYLKRKYNRYIELKQLTSSQANATEDLGLLVRN